MKTILQSEAAECGLASLAMVADAYGMRIGLAELRRRFPMSLKGAKLNHLIHIAQQLGFQTRPLRLDMEDLGKLKLPCVLHWDLNHFVVLAKVGKSKKQGSESVKTGVRVKWPVFRGQGSQGTVLTR